MASKQTITQHTVALVTGANRGIGKEVCRQLAKAGFTVFLTGRSLEKAEAATNELDDQNLIPAQLDVTNTSSISALYKRIEREAGRLDVLINNAGILPDRGQNPSNIDLELVKETFDTNLFGAWQMCHSFLPLLRKSQHPRIVNVSSTLGSLADMSARTPAYNTSKTALNALTGVLAAELRSEGILVNSIAPGWVATDMGGDGGRPVKDGAEGIVWAATLPDDGPSGGFFKDGESIDW